MITPKHEETIKEIKFKITFIGMSGSGKTSIINRLINNSFSETYNPTLEKTPPNLSQGNNGISDSNKTSNTPQSQSTPDDKLSMTKVTLILEDLFGLNNTILQTPEKFIKSNDIIQLRKQMVKDFQEIILTNKNLEYKKNYNKNSERKSMRGKTPLPDLLKDEPDRVGFIFVIDSNASEKIYSDTEAIIQKLRNVERNSSLMPSEKCIIFTKSDLALDKKGGINIKEKEKKIIKELGCEYFVISSKSTENFKESLNSFFNSLCANRIEKKKEETPKPDLTPNDEEAKNCINIECTNKGLTCG